MICRCLCALLVISTQAVSAAVIHVPADYLTVQEGINAAAVGDTVEVAAGTYFGNIVVDKPITLQGASSAETTLDGQGVGSVVSINANSVVVRNVRVRSSGPVWIEDSVLDAGINVLGFDSCLIDRCRFSENGRSGVGLAMACYNTIANCTFSNSEEGVVFYAPTWIDNVRENIGNVIRRCSFSSHTHCSIQFTHGASWHRENIAEENCMAAGQIGLYLIQCYANTIRYNYIAGNVSYGIFHYVCTCGGGDNVLHHNTLVNNGDNATDMGSFYDPNYWFSPADGEGNYWSDYDGTDGDGDGIGDSEYEIGGSPFPVTDWYPLMWRPDPYSQCVGIRGNVDGDPADAIDIADLVYLVDYMFSGGLPPMSLDEANIDGLGETDISDLVYLVDYMFNSGPAPPPCP